MNRSNSGANTSTVQILLDILILVGCFGLDMLVRGNTLSADEMLGMTILFAVFAVIYILSNKEEYLYNVTLFYYLDRVHRKVTKSFLIAMISTAFLVRYVGEGKAAQQYYLLFLVMTYVVVCIRVFLYVPLYRLFDRDYVPRTAFVGTRGSFNKFRYFLAKTTIKIDEIGYIAMYEQDYMEEPGVYIGHLGQLEELIRRYHIDQVYIIQKHGDDLPFTQQYVDLCISMGVTVRLIVDFYKRRRANSYVSTVGTYPIITYHTITLNTYEQTLKRAMDVVGGLVGIILSSPIMLLAAIAIKLDSPGPILFKQTRIGKNGREFKIFKFRSMYIDAEERKKELMAKNEIQGGIMFKMKDDPRITRVGKIIRKLSIDELPQFFNVVGGSMSLVGTRPPTLDEVNKYETTQWRRISIKPGITGMWQVSGRSKIQSFEEIVGLDVEYIDNWSLSLDVKIILKTVWVLLKHDDAY